MVRLVFRPYTQVRRTICTSVSLRASTRVSSGFALLRHSSPSFGSQQVCSYSNLSQKIMVGRRCAEAPACQVPCASWVFYPPTRIHVRLLGPCFKTGRLKAFCQLLLVAVPEGRSDHHALVASAASARLPTFPAVIPPKQPELTSTQHIQRLVKTA